MRNRMTMALSISALIFNASPIVTAVALADAPAPAAAPVPVAPAPAAPSPGEVTYQQLDADLRALVQAINARLAPVTDDMNQLKDRLHAAPKEAPPAK